MANKSAPLLPATAKLLTAAQMAERAGMAPMTLRNVERGNAGVTIGAYVAVMQVLGVAQDITLMAKADEAGRDLQDARLAAPRKTRAKLSPTSDVATLPKPARKPLASAPKTKSKSHKFSAGYTSLESLAEIIEQPMLLSRLKNRD